VFQVISAQKYEDAMGAEGLVVVASECVKFDTTYLLIALTLCTLFYSDFKISYHLFWHAGFKQSLSVISNLFCACKMYTFYVGKLVFLLCASYRKYTGDHTCGGGLVVLCIG
jgi:hypothetical protein